MLKQLKRLVAFSMASGTTQVSKPVEKVGLNGLQREDTVSRDRVKRLPSIDTAADLLERQIIIINRTAWFEQQKREESEKPVPDLKRIADLDKMSRDCNEYRSALRNRINDLFFDIANGEGYYAVRENRTFTPPNDRFVDMIAIQAEEVSKLFWGKEVADSLEKELQSFK